MCRTKEAGPTSWSLEVSIFVKISHGPGSMPVGLGIMFRIFDFCKYVEWFLECHQANLMLSNSNTNYCVVKCDVKFNVI